MAQIGDLFAKLGSGQTLSMGEIETLRLEMNRLQNAASRLDTIMAPAGGLEPNVFRNSGAFSILPHNTASLNRATGTASGNLSAGDDAWTTVTFDAYDAANNTATISHGLAIDPANGRIYVTGLDKETWTLIACRAQFAANATGMRGVMWTSDTGDDIYNLGPAGTAASVQGSIMLAHLRQIKSDYTYYGMKVYQNSGGALNCVHMYMSVAVIR